MSNNNSRPATPQETEAIRAELERRTQMAPEVPYLVRENGGWTIKYQKSTLDWDPSWRFVILSK